MKLRRLAEDFQVQEQSDLPIGNQGIFSVYELRKTGWTTLDALGRLSRVINLPRKSIVHAGLKDRHALTSQFITIRHGPRRNWTEEKISLTYLGQSTREISPLDIRANRFEIVLRSLSDSEQTAAEDALPGLRAAGLPNYFDDQRFGSWFPDEGFIAEAWIREDYEKALWLTFAEHQPEDNAEERTQKAILREHWKDWAACKQKLNRSHRRSIVTYLCDKPDNFKGAWGIVNGDLRGLYLSALQSDLWNAIVSEFIARNCDADQLTPVSLKTGPVNFPQQFKTGQFEILRNAEIPLPSARVKLEKEPFAELINSVLATRGWKLSELKVRFPRDRYFSRHRRRVLLPLDDLQFEFAEDELETGKPKLKLNFSLPRGSYATMVVKRLWSQSTKIDSLQP